MCYWPQRIRQVNASICVSACVVAAESSADNRGRRSQLWSRMTAERLQNDCRIPDGQIWHDIHGLSLVYIPEVFLHSFWGLQDPGVTLGITRCCHDFELGIPFELCSPSDRKRPFLGWSPTRHRSLSRPKWSIRMALQAMALITVLIDSNNSKMHCASLAGQPTECWLLGHEQTESWHSNHMVTALLNASCSHL